MNFFLLAFVFQIFGLYAMILLSDYVKGARLKKSPVRIRSRR